jgi:hypothetical protein
MFSDEIWNEKNHFSSIIPVRYKKNFDLLTAIKLEVDIPNNFPPNISFQLNAGDSTIDIYVSVHLLSGNGYTEKRPPYELNKITNEQIAYEIKLFLNRVF